MAFQYDPMEIDGLTVDKSEFIDEDDEMDFTHEPLIKTMSSDNIYISSSFFQHTYNKSGEICSNVSDMFGKVTIDDNESTTHETQLIAPQSPPSSPAQRLSPIARIEHSSIDTPVTPISLPNSPEMSTSPSQEIDSSPFTAVSNRTNHYNPTHNPTFVYHAAQPVDANHGRIAYVFGLFKISCYSIILFCCIYIGYQLVLNIHHDMKSKITSYESDLLGNQIYCQEQYHANRCGPNTRLPAVQDLCRNWEQCMMRPFSIGKTKILAEIMGEAANGFSEILSLKTMIYSLCIIYGFIWSFSHILKAHASNGQQQNNNTTTSTRYPSINQRLVYEPLHDNNVNSNSDGSFLN